MRLKYMYVLLLSVIIFSCQTEPNEPLEMTAELEYESGYQDFLDLGKELMDVRDSRLVDLDEFLEMQKDLNTIVLDSRSKDLYENKHLYGAVNLPFTNYTQMNLEKLIPNRQTRILIYCNNNFKGDIYNFGSKRFNPNKFYEKIDRQKKPILLALNIPTFITLYGYGYDNVYELKEVVDIKDSRLDLDDSSLRRKFLKEVVINGNGVKEDAPK